MSPNQAETNFSKFAIFRISPLIRLTLLSLYIALTIPLPFLAKVVASPIPPALLWLGISIGFILLFGALSERVILTNEQIKVTYPLWFPKFLRKGWELNWSEIKDLKMRTTGQGGLVYYFTSNAQEKAYLLPMRVVGFARLLKLVETQTAIDTSDIRPLSQPWMYLILLVFTIFLLLVDTWAIVNAMTTNLIT
ncbi:MAG: hypothetical protein SAK42_08490 [Oscillatoria sp. PMC 1076.18]|nr:hypothetical protein [Oscillatoria sp. PMC 1076.18]